MKTEEQDWKEVIGQAFAEKGIYRLEYLNKTLEKIITEYTDYLNKFDNITVGMGKGESKYGLPYNSSSFTVQYPMYFPFIILIGYTADNDSNEIILKVKFTAKMKIDKLWGASEQAEDIANHILSEEDIIGEHIFDEQFIYWKLNDLVKKWLNKSESND